MKNLCLLWRGELPLPVAFWTWAVSVGLCVNVTTSLLFALLIVADRPVEALIVGYALSVPYNVVAAVGVWRAADRYDGPPRWVAVAKTAAVVGLTLLSLT